MPAKRRGGGGARPLPPARAGEMPDRPPDWGPSKRRHSYCQLSQERNAFRRGIEKSDAKRRLVRIEDGRDPFDGTVQHVCH